MKTIFSLSALLGMLILAVPSTHATSVVDPLLSPLNGEKSAVLQLPQGEGKTVLIKFKNYTEDILMEVEVDAEAHPRKSLDLSRLDPGTYFMDIFHDGEITRKELSVHWDEVKVTSVTKMEKEPAAHPSWYWWL